MANQESKELFATHLWQRGCSLLHPAACVRLIKEANQFPSPSKGKPITLSLIQNWEPRGAFFPGVCASGVLAAPPQDLFRGPGQALPLHGRSQELGVVLAHSSRARPAAFGGFWVPSRLVSGFMYIYIYIYQLRFFACVNWGRIPSSFSLWGPYTHEKREKKKKKGPPRSARPHQSAGWAISPEPSASTAFASSCSSSRRRRRCRARSERSWVSPACVGKPKREFIGRGLGGKKGLGGVWGGGLLQKEGCEGCVNGTCSALSSASPKASASQLAPQNRTRPELAMSISSMRTPQAIVSTEAPAS